MKIFRHIGRFSLITALFLLLISCGPAVELPIAPANPANPATVPTTPSQQAAPPAGNLAVQTESAATRNNLPVGFTESGHPYMGNPDAPVVINEFSDYQCTFCARFKSQTMPGLMQDALLNGEAVIVFHDYPLEQIHPQAAAAANAARCAGEQGAFWYWEMHDALFDNMRLWSVSNPAEAFRTLAADIQLPDSEAFGSCVAENRYAALVSADVAKGNALGISGTPSFEINGSLLVGAQPLAAFNSAISRAKSGQPAVAVAPTPDPSRIEEPVPVALSDEVAATLGNPDAKVVIVEFTDYQCPFCARHATQTLPALKQEWVDSGRAFYILKDLPLDSIHAQARRASVAARCAGEQDNYWGMHDLLFRRQGEWSGSADADTLFTGFATALALDTAAFGSCLASGKYDAAIEANVQEAFSLGISGTPFYIVQGFPVISGAQPLDVFNQVLTLAEDDELVTAIMEAQRRQLEAQAAQAAQPPAPTGPVDVPIDNAFYVGDPDAPVVIVEYSSLQCSFCARHYTQTYKLLRQNFIETGVVRYVFKDFPLINSQPQSLPAAHAARCAGEQGQYADMHGLLLENQRAWSGQSTFMALFSGYAAQLNLDTAAFADCMESNRHEAAIQADIAEGSRLGVRGTPAFFINGNFVSGAQPYDVFAEAIRLAQGGGR
jgi:protein-disulfide isomerase